MDSPDILSSSKSHPTSEVASDEHDPPMMPNNESLVEIENQVIANIRKPNTPNVNVPEKIVICLDVCHDDTNSLYKLGDGSTFTPMNMLKRILDFLIYSKNAINKKTEFALLIMKNNEPQWIQNFTNNLKDILSSIDHLVPEESTSETFEFANVFNLIKQKVEIPEYKQEKSMAPPSNVVRLLVIYGRSNCMPVIIQDDQYINFLKKQLYFYIDILYTHEENCGSFNCAEIYDTLQHLDNGYSYVFEVSRNARKVHDCIAKLLAHPLQRPLQKNTDYSFGTRHGL